MLSGWKRFFAPLWVFALASSPLFAQSEVGTTAINGTITDPSGAVVPGAKVTVKNGDIGFSRASTSTGAGFYNFTELPVGVYELTIEQAGFSKAVRSGIHLSVGSSSPLAIQLRVRASPQTVDVSAEAPVVETSRTEASTGVSTRQIQELPINGRNFLDFTLTTPGVVRDPTRTGDLSFGGQRGTSNSLLIDGSDANNTFYGQSTGRTGTGRNPYSFSEDAVQEFQVNTNGYAAEIGRAGGGVINVITKSGSNGFHGDVFEFYRDKAPNANSWDNNHANGGKGAIKAPYHFNQFGANVGGPI